MITKTDRRRQHKCFTVTAMLLRNLLRTILFEQGHDLGGKITLLGWYKLYKALFSKFPVSQFSYVDLFYMPLDDILNRTIDYNNSLVVIKKWSFSGVLDVWRWFPKKCFQIKAGYVNASFPHYNEPSLTLGLTRWILALNLKGLKMS